MADIAILVYPQAFKPTWRVKDSFEWRGNIGPLMLKDVLERNGYSVDFCSPESAGRFKIVLVSLVSIYDYYNFIFSVSRLKSWRQRSNTVFIGGFGLRNAAPIRNYADYAVFGRGEEIIIAAVSAILAGKDIEGCPSIMKLRHFPHTVTFAQSATLYPHSLDTKPNKYREHALGCPHRCYFCIYSHARRFVKEGGDPYYEQSTQNTMSKELMLTDIKTKWNGQSIHVRTSIDGWSHRLRYAFNKHISDDDIIEMIEFVSKKQMSASTIIIAYMITGYPTETESEMIAFFELLKRAQPMLGKVIINLHAIPFRPAPITPSAWLSANINTDWKNRIPNIKIIKQSKYEVNYDRKGIEGPWSLLQSLIVERATEATDDIIQTICFPSPAFKRLCGRGKVDALQHNYDIEQYTKEYAIEEQTTLPTWYLESYTPNHVIRKNAEQLRANLYGTV